MIPKLTALARARCSPETASGAIPATSAAVRRWTSSPAPEGIDQALVARVVGEDAQLDLRVVRRQEPAALGRHEGLADAHPIRAADRDVLDVGLRRRDPSGGGAELMEGRMDAPGARVHERRQRVDVGVLELAEPAVREDLQRQIVLRRELREHVFVRRVAGLGLPDRPELQLLEQDLLQLLRRGDQEALSGQRVDLLLELRELPAEVPREARQRGFVDPHPGALHAREHARERELRAAVERVHPGLRELAGERLFQTPRGAGLRPGPGRHLLERDLARRARLRAAAGELVPARAARVPSCCDASASNVREPLGSSSATASSASKAGAESSSPCSANQTWSRLVSRADQGMRDRALEQAAQPGDRLRGSEPAGEQRVARERNVGGPLGPEREGESRRAGVHRQRVAEDGEERDRGQRPQLRHQRVQLGERLDAADRGRAGPPAGRAFSRLRGLRAAA